MTPERRNIRDDIIHWRDTGEWPNGAYNFPQLVLEEMDRLKEADDREAVDQLTGRLNQARELLRRCVDWHAGISVTHQKNPFLEVRAFLDFLNGEES